MVSLKGQGLLPSSQRWHDIAVSCRFSEKTTNPGKKKTPKNIRKLIWLLLGANHYFEKLRCYLIPLT